jgi:pilus assembly protein CpaF
MLAIATVENEVRDLIRHSGLDPIRDVDEVRALVRDTVTDYDDRSLAGGLPRLDDLDQATKSVFDAVAGIRPIAAVFRRPRG